MKKNLGMLLLAIWLIANGAIALLSITFSGIGMVMAVLSIAAGVCLVLGK